MGLNHPRDEHRSLAATRYLEQTARRLSGTLHDRASLVPTLAVTLLLLVLLGAWLWGRCLLWPAESIGEELVDDADGSYSDFFDVGSDADHAPTKTASAVSVAAAGSTNGTSAAQCVRSAGSLFLLFYVCALLAVLVILVLALGTVPRLRHQLEVVYHLLRADRAGGVQLVLTEVIRAVREGDMAQAERMARGNTGNVSYGTILPTVLLPWEPTQP